LLSPPIARKSLLVTPPRMSKVERRQLFEAQVKAADQMAAEYQRQQQQMQQEQYEQVLHVLNLPSSEHSLLKEKILFFPFVTKAKRSIVR